MKTITYIFPYFAIKLNPYVSAHLPIFHSSPVGRNGKLGAEVMAEKKGGSK